MSCGGRIIPDWPDEAFEDLSLTTDTYAVLISHNPGIDDPTFATTTTVSASSVTIGPNVTFNASGLPSGVYFYRLKAGRDRKSKTLVLSR